MSLISKQTGRNVFKLGVAVEALMLVKYALAAPKTGKDLVGE